MQTILRWGIGCSLLMLLTQSSCGTAETDAAAAEQPITLAASRCEMGSLPSVGHCGGVEAACHVCGRVDPAVSVGQCLQPCTLGTDSCGNGQTCHPMSELLGAGYARIGDCPAGYCL